MHFLCKYIIHKINIVYCIRNAVIIREYIHRIIKIELYFNHRQVKQPDSRLPIYYDIIDMETSDARPQFVTQAMFT